MEELKRVKNINHNQIISIMKQLLLVLSYCERNEIAHRNIKPSHIVLNI